MSPAADAVAGAGGGQRPAPADDQRIAALLAAAHARLVGEMVPAGHWRGELSSSALATATAIVALRCAGGDGALVAAGLSWLDANRNHDGGWGDTPASLSNLSTTVLVWAALRHCGAGEARWAAGVRAAEAWIASRAGGLDAACLVRAVEARYGEDRTFAVPILTLCAIAGVLGEDPWRHVRQLPFELAACPRRWFRLLRLQVVSYALPALIAVGRVRHRLRPTRNPLARLLRRLAAGRTLRLLGAIQPASGGYLEAVPLTAFVVMSLCAGGDRDERVVAEGVAFLRRLARADGSWAIDADLAIWLTTLAVNALAAGDGLEACLDAQRRARLADWLLGQQQRTVHAYTGAAPGGWAWTDLPGGVPDADDTAGALIALRHLAAGDARAAAAARQGLAWLAGLVNGDGGMPTFCRGWGALEFDRSAADLTAHALLAAAAWADAPSPAVGRLRAAGCRYLMRSQRADGAWTPLWFGNERIPGEVNPTYATARVLLGLAGVLEREGAADPAWRARWERGVGWLLACQGGDGGWGGGPGSPSSIEETALAIDALARCLGVPATPAAARAAMPAALRAGIAWLDAATAGCTRFPPAPIGFYFAKLWYFERLYPLVFTVAALGRARRALASAPAQRIVAQAGDPPPPVQPRSERP